MNTKRGISALMFSLLLLLGSVPAWAVSLNSTWAVSRNNTDGTTSQNMSSSATTFCYLSKVGVEETDTSNEKAMCQVLPGNSLWTLQAVLGVNSDADVECRAYCYNN
jgi:hypothetical protein